MKDFGGEDKGFLVKITDFWQRVQIFRSCMANYDWPFGTLPFGLFWSNLDTRDLETYPRIYSGHF